jgi:hypothetical protein
MPSEEDSMKQFWWLSILLFSMGLIFISHISAEVTVQRLPEKAIVKIDGEPFTEYLIESGTGPVLWPILGPTGKPMTRAYPLEKHTGEKFLDHPHQRSLWFSHGNVNGIDFWSLEKGHGIIRHREFEKTDSGPIGFIVTRNDWIGPDGEKQCEDKRTLQFGSDADCRWIDFAVTIQATDRPVTFGDTKEGAFGIRVAESLAVDSKQGGRIINSAGQINEAAWGKPASWVDYQGPIAGDTLGIAVLNHPSSFRFPTYWHVRSYGLFAANPFGLKAFADKKAEEGSYIIAPGNSLTLRYRVILHRGDEKQGGIAQRYEEYSK